MAVASLRGFRDFYPEDQFNINYLKTKIAVACALFGYEEFEGPALESFALYSAKSSDEIVNDQAFLINNKGNGDKQMVLRPELTPTLARMIAARQNQLTFPLRWWSFGRFWRYERPQKGRGREFYQWNCDCMGLPPLEAEVELLEIIITFFRSLGLTEKDIVIEVSDRSFLNQKLSDLAFDAVAIQKIFRLIDKMSKLSTQEFTASCRQLGFNPVEVQRLEQFITDLQANNGLQSERLAILMKTMKSKQLQGWIKPNLTITRGFNYYTDFVFEVCDRQKTYRAMVGGGRYDNLVAAVGGEPVSGVGFGMGDMVLLDYLASKDLLPTFTPAARVCVIRMKETQPYSQTVIEALRQAGINTVCYDVNDNPGKGLKYASLNKIPFAVLIGQNEINAKTTTLKNLATGQQDSLSLPQVITTIKKSC